MTFLTTRHYIFSNSLTFQTFGDFDMIFPDFPVCIHPVVAQIWTILIKLQLRYCQTKQTCLAHMSIDRQRASKPEVFWAAFLCLWGSGGDVKKQVRQEKRCDFRSYTNYKFFPQRQDLQQEGFACKGKPLRARNKSTDMASCTELPWQLLKNRKLECMSTT